MPTKSMPKEQCAVETAHSRRLHFSCMRRLFIALRFIPAYAGNTPSPRARSTPGTVHPRLRGEHAMVTAQSVGKAGSSPPTRGTPLQVSCSCFQLRFIPAYAGNTATRCRMIASRPVHPRLRGEHWLMMQPHRQTRGSSPPTRGTRAWP